MGEENDSPQLSAPAAASDEGHNKQRTQSRPKMSGNKPYLAHSKNEQDQEQESNVNTAPPSDLQAVPQGMLDRSLQAQLGRQLRAIFSDVAQEPVPDRFVKLLEALETREKRR